MKKKIEFPLVAFAFLAVFAVRTTQLIVPHTQLGSELEAGGSSSPVETVQNLKPEFSLNLNHENLHHWWRHWRVDHRYCN